MTEQGIRKDTKLKVHIVDAVNLGDDETLDYQVKVFQDNSMSETKQREGPGPIWNEAILFDISDAEQPVVVQVVIANRNEEVVLQSEISLSEGLVRDYTLQGSDIWCYGQPQNVCGLTDVKSGQPYYWFFDPETGRSEPCDAPEPELEEGPKVRIRIHYSYSDV